MHGKIIQFSNLKNVSSIVSTKMRGSSLYFKKRESKCMEQNIINHNKDYYNSCSNKCPLFGES